MKITIVLIALFLISSTTRANNTSDIEITVGTRDVFDKYEKEVSAHRNLPINDLIIETAKFFLGKPYIASALDKNDKEKLVVDLTGFDCTTFVENCIALSLALKSGNDEISGDKLFETYCSYLQNIRYRNGVIDGYPSRLHYMTDWAYDNELKGTLKNITVDLGGKITNKKINYISTHPQSYKQLADDKDNRKKIRSVEDAINVRNDYTIILKKNISGIESIVNNGDIIIFATSVDGLDYSHVGIAYKKSNTLYFIHASTQSMTIKVEGQTLNDYSLKSGRCTGVTVLRLAQI